MNEYEIPTCGMFIDPLDDEAPHGPFSSKGAAIEDARLFSVESEKIMQKAKDKKEKREMIVIEVSDIHPIMVADASLNH